MIGSDRLFAKPLAEIAGFRFDHRVVEVFPDMIRRSVPGYETIVAMTGTLAERYAQPGTRCYDLGCSLGASTLALRQGIGARDCTIVAADNAPAMIERCRAVLAADAGAAPVELCAADIRELDIADASVVVLNFTLQFIAPAERAALIGRIRAGLVPGGVLVLSEKIAFADAALDALMIDLHHAFKRAHGYSELEIAQKRAALEAVLIPETLDVHRARLRDAGFAAADVWFQCFNFASLLAFA
ncbi:MAG: carboxy-S-adenosyl-L-methionine synthase CmoA [Pseudomonadales bacterium]|nr:carboxy-S-adenosyl-L-methionine synthase CmoA [Pseudomonadales bacterium]